MIYDVNYIEDGINGCFSREIEANSAYEAKLCFIKESPELESKIISVCVCEE